MLVELLNRIFQTVKTTLGYLYVGVFALENRPKRNYYIIVSLPNRYPDLSLCVFERYLTQ